MSVDYQRVKTRQTHLGVRVEVEDRSEGVFRRRGYDPALYRCAERGPNAACLRNERSQAQCESLTVVRALDATWRKSISGVGEGRHLATRFTSPTTYLPRNDFRPYFQARALGDHRGPELDCC